MREQSATRKLGVTLTGSRVHATKLVGASVYTPYEVWSRACKWLFLHIKLEPEICSQWNLYRRGGPISHIPMGLFLSLAWTESKVPSAKANTRIQHFQKYGVVWCSEK